MMHTISKKWRPDNSPISHLVITDIEIDDDEATVTMSKPQHQSGTSNGDTAQAQDLEVKFRWAGSGWLITDDNIMGIDGAIAKSLPEPQKNKLQNKK